MTGISTVAGIWSVYIKGYAKGPKFIRGDVFVRSEHAWNAAKINGEWKMFEITWNTGFMVPKKNKFRIYIQQIPNPFQSGLLIY